MNLREVTFTNHFVKQARSKGFTADQIRVAIEQDFDTDPKVYVNEVRNPKHKGQLRFCGSGVAVVMDGNDAITIYADKIKTPLRPDQMNDPSALNSHRINH